MDMNDLRRFITRHASAQNPACSHFILRHLTGKSQSVARIECGADSVTDDWVDATALEIANAARSDAGSIGGVNRYAVLAIYEGETDPRARFVFREGDGLDTDESDDFGSESPSARGLVAQLMRHNEALNRSTIQGFGAVMSTQSRIVDKLSGMVESLLSERFESAEAVAAMLENKARQEGDRAIAQAKAKAIDAATEKTLALFPLVAAKMLGPKAADVVPGGKDDPNALVVESFLETITEPQLESLHLALKKPGQAECLVELFAGYKARAEARKANKPTPKEPDLVLLMDGLLLSLDPEQAGALQSAFDRMEQLVILGELFEGAKKRAEARRAAKAAKQGAS